MSTVIETPPQAETPKSDMAPQRPQPQKLIVQDDSELSYMIDTAKYEQVYRFARQMAGGTLVPKHLLGETFEGTIANCFRVTNQALRWGLDPFAVADESYVVGGKLGYQGKLVAAVVMKHGNLLGRLRKEHSGVGPDLTITISGRFKDDPDNLCSITLSVRQAQTKNEMWIKDPKQKLWYSGVTKWARMHCPEVLLGVLTENDLEQIAEQNPATRPVSLAGLSGSAQGHLDDRRPVTKPDDTTPSVFAAGLYKLIDEADDDEKLTYAAKLVAQGFQQQRLAQGEYDGMLNTIELARLRE